MVYILNTWIALCVFSMQVINTRLCINDSTFCFCWPSNSYIWLTDLIVTLLLAHSTWGGERVEGCTAGYHRSWEEGYSWTEGKYWAEPPHFTCCSFNSQILYKQFLTFFLLLTWQIDTSILGGLVVEWTRNKDKCTNDDELKDGASFTHGLLLCIL